MEYLGTDDGLSDLWICPRCGARLVSPNLWHSCGTFTVEDLRQITARDGAPTMSWSDPRRTWMANLKHGCRSLTTPSHAEQSTALTRQGHTTS